MDELNVSGLSNRLNWLRAGVLGANDGIVSVGGLVMGVAGATSLRSDLAVSGIAGLVAGALSMAAGEYVSVSAQRDSEHALLRKEQTELTTMPEEELDELVAIIESKGIDGGTALTVAQQLTARNALKAHAVLELGIDPDDVVRPWTAAFASMAAFTVGALLPMLTILLPHPLNLWVTVAAVGVALALTGWASARLGYARPGRPMLRTVVGGLFALAVTFGIGSLVGTAL